MYDHASYNYWLYEILNPDDKMTRQGGSIYKPKKKEKLEYDGENEAFLNETDEEKLKRNLEQIEKMKL